MVTFLQGWLTPTPDASTVATSRQEGNRQDLVTGEGRTL